LAYRNKISLSGVGFDIACGNLAIRSDATRAQVAPPSTIMDEVCATFQLRHRAPRVRRESITRLFDDEVWR